jgi:hypothetical protein
MRYKILAISVANMSFIKVWDIILNPSYHNEKAYGINVLAVMLDVLIVGFLIWAGATLAIKYGGKYGLFLVKAAFLVLTVSVARNVYKIVVGGLSVLVLKDIFGKVLTTVILCIVGVAVIFVLIKWFQNVVRFAQILVLLISPLFVIFAAQTIWMLVQTDFNQPESFSSKTTGPSSTFKKRIVWIIFDELDYKVVFAKRPESLQIPELERFSKESFSATRAYPPASQTKLSIPALTTGRLVAETQEKGIADLQLRFENSKEFMSWKAENIFAKLNKLGGTSGVVGWYHAYCRLFSDDLTRCLTDYTYTFPFLLVSKHPDSLIGSMTHYFYRVAYERYLPRTRYYIELIQNINDKAGELAVDEGISLALLHYPVPHGPFVYNHKSGEFAENARANYFDSVALVDRTLGDLRKRMEREKVWDKTIVIITSDHWWRRDPGKIKEFLLTDEERSIVSEEMDYRVPFMIKTVGNEGESDPPLVYDSEFNTVLTQDLILKMLKGEISSKRDIERFLENNRSIGKTPY